MNALIIRIVRTRGDHLTFLTHEDSIETIDIQIESTRNAGDHPTKSTQPSRDTHASKTSNVRPLCRRKLGAAACKHGVGSGFARGTQRRVQYHLPIWTSKCVHCCTCIPLSYAVGGNHRESHKLSVGSHSSVMRAHLHVRVDRHRADEDNMQSVAMLFTAYD